MRAWRNRQIAQICAPLAFMICVFAAGCAATLKKTSAKPFVTLEVNPRAASSLLSASLPANNLEIVDEPIDSGKFARLASMIKDFNSHGDAILTEIFSQFYGTRVFFVPVIVTQGVPPPYDAWTAQYENQTTIFFSLNNWDLPRIERVAMPIIKHEVTHVLLKPLLKLANANDYEAQLMQIVLNEGIAHFIGYARDRGVLLREKEAECVRAEKELQKAMLLFRAPDTGDNEKRAALEKSNTGAYWEKYGAIAGLCRAARVFEKAGAAGLINAIKESRFDGT